MMAITNWISSCMPSAKTCVNEFDKLRLDSMQDEAIKKLKEGREFMVSAIESISAKYNNETEDE